MRVAIIPVRIVHHVGSRQLPLRKQVSRIDGAGDGIEKRNRILTLTNWRLRRNRGQLRCGAGERAVLGAGMGTGLGTGLGISAIATRGVPVACLSAVFTRGLPALRTCAV